MVRAWIIFSCLTLSVLFRAFSYETEDYFQFFNGKPFPFSDRLLDKHSYVYFAMELIIAIGYAACMIIRDDTPKFLLWLFFAILVLDLLHYILWMRDEGPGWNIIKCAMFAVGLLYYELPRLWKQFRR
jgi:hypothetical protein